MKKNNFEIYFVLFLYLLCFFTTNFVLLNETLFINSFGNTLEYEKIKDIYEKQKSISWISPFILTFLQALKYSLISFIIFAGIIFTNGEVKFSKIYKIVAVSDLIFIIPLLIKVCYFGFINTSYTIDSLQKFTTLSLNIFFHPNNDLVINIFNQFNLFELIFIFLLVYNLKLQLQISFQNAFKIICISYLPSMLVWIMLLTFFQL